MPAGDIIIAAAEMEGDVLKKLYEFPPPGKRNLYLPIERSYMELRPQVELRGYVVKELWDRFSEENRKGN